MSISSKYIFDSNGRNDGSELARLWRFRVVGFFFAWRNLKERYKHAVLGLIWVVFQPIILMSVLWLIFGSDSSTVHLDLDYRVYVFPSLIAWQLYSRCFSEAATSVLREQRIITKIYFPRSLLPLSSFLGAIPDFTVLYILTLIGFMFCGIYPGIYSICIVPAVVVLLISGYGISLLLSSLIVDYRDILYTLPFLTQIFFFLSPIFYSPSLVDKSARLFYCLNPFVSVCELFRYSFLGVRELSQVELFFSLGSGLLVAVIGVAMFQAREYIFVDKLGSGA